MKRLSVILAAVLAVQVVLALALTQSGTDYGPFEARTPLLAFDADKIDKITIDQGEGTSLTLGKQGDEWIIPSLDDFPADGDKVKSFIGRLAELKKGWPVATTAAAASRFKVTDDAHERRIVLSGSDEEMAKMLLGTSPAYRRVHARAVGEDEIFSVAFATYDANVGADDWMDRDFLAISEAEITRIEFANLTLDQKDGQFTVAGLADDERLVDSKVRTLVRAVSRPRFDAVRGRGEEALSKVNQPDLQFTVKRNDDTTVTYRYKKDAEGEAYFFASSAHNYLFRVGKTAVDDILNIGREQLIEDKDENKGES